MKWNQSLYHLPERDAGMGRGTLLLGSGGSNAANGRNPLALVTIPSGLMVPGAILEGLVVFARSGATDNGDLVARGRNNTIVVLATPLPDNGNVYNLAEFKVVALGFDAAANNVGATVRTWVAAALQGVTGGFSSVPFLSDSWDLIIRAPNTDTTTVHSWQIRITSPALYAPAAPRSKLTP